MDACYSVREDAFARSGFNYLFPDQEVQHHHHTSLVSNVLIKFLQALQLYQLYWIAYIKKRKHEDTIKLTPLHKILSLLKFLLSFDIEPLFSSVIKSNGSQSVKGH